MRQYIIYYAIHNHKQNVYKYTHTDAQVYNKEKYILSHFLYHFYEKNVQIQTSNVQMHIKCPW